MKKLFLLLIIASTIMSGCKSKEEKAQEAIKKEMFKTLYDFESYEPIETKVDSSYYSIYTDTTIIKRGYILSALLDEANQTLEKAQDATNTMEIWSDLSTSYGRRKFNKAKDEADKYLLEASVYSKLMTAESDTIKILSSKTKKSFNGWKVTHKFRCKTKGGNSTIGTYIYIFDKDMKNIIYQEDTEDEDLKRVKRLIKEAVEKEENNQDE